MVINDVNFQRIDTKTFKTKKLSKMLFVMISQSGIVNKSGYIYFFTPTGAFFMTKNDYDKNFVDKILVSLGDWNLLNAYFCDFLIINPKIYDSFVHELCKRNFCHFWFDSAIEIYRDKYCK